ncbi:MAG: bifunctional metallophosphatase/5'-nucleotidase [Clostridia bacterium]|nr:bifunctional metallophosphatase/5'-nucleotidase [Clostridia bacterium]
MNKKVFACLLAIVMLLGLIVVPAAAKAEGEEAKEIVILYTNDVHCGIVDGLGYAGVARVKAAFEAAGKEVILVDNGDATQGDVIGTLSKGEAIVELMNAVGYDVATIGNHEFDYGMEQFNKNVSLAKFQYVCCNFLNDKGEAVLKPYTIVEKAGKKIAFVGIDTPEAFTKSTPVYFQDGEGNYIFSFCEGNNGQDLYDKVQETVDAARAEGADYVIVLAHLGIDYQSAPWMSTDVITNTTGIDAVLDGHSHSVIAGDAVKNKDGENVILTSTGTKLDNVGIFTIDGEGKMSSMLLDADAIKFMDAVGALTEDNGAGEAVAAAIAKNDELVNTVVAKTSVTLTTTDPVAVDEKGNAIRIVRSQETNLGDLCADAYRAMGQADIAFVNGGGIRANINEGDITYGQIIKVHPYGNALCVVEATGQEILDALELSVCSLPGESGGFLHVSGLKFSVDMNVDSTVVKDEKKMFVEVAGDRRIKDVEVLQEDGTYAPIDPNKTYTLACHNYLLRDMGDGYTMFADNNFLQEDVMLDNQVLINYIVEKLGGTVGGDYVDPYGQGRITIIPKA